MANVKQIRFGGTLPTKILFADGTECRRVYAGDTIVWNPNQYYLILTPPTVTADATHKTYNVQVESYKNEDKEPLAYTVTANGTYDWVTFTDNNNVTSFEVKADDKYRAGATVTTSATTVQGTVGRKGGTITVDPFEFTFTNPNRPAVKFTYKQEESGDKREFSISQTGGSGVGGYTLTSPSESWLHINGNNITADENSDEVRNGTVTAVSNDDPTVKILINITQDSASYEFNVTPTSDNVVAAGGNTTVNVVSTKNDAPIGYTVSKVGSADWVTFSDASNKTTYTVSADNKARSGALISVTPSSGKINGTARSTGGEVELDSFDFRYVNTNRGPVNFEYTQNSSGNKKTYSITQVGGDGSDEYTFESKSSWLTVSGGKIIAEAISAEGGERTGTVIIKSKTDPTKTITATINQVPKVFVLTLAPESRTFVPTGGEENVVITSTVEVDGVVSDTPYSNPTETCDWVTLTNSAKNTKYTVAEDNKERTGATISAGGNIEVALDSSAATNVNTSKIDFTYVNAQRSATFAYKQTESGGQSKVFTVKQEGGSGKSVNYSIGSPSQSWIKVNGNIVSVEANESGADREGTVTATHYTDSSKKVVVTIKQPNAKYEFSISPESQTLTSAASNDTVVNVVSKKNDAAIGYTVAKKGTIDWVTFTDASNKTTYNVSADDKARSGATITVSPSSGTISASVKSAGGTVNFDTFKFEYANKNRVGEFTYTQSSSNIVKTFTITQGGGIGVDDYTFESKSDWLTVEGTTVKASAIPVGESERTGTVLIKSKTDSSKTITATVKQVPKVFVLEVNAAPLEFTAAGGTCNATIVSTVDVDGVVSDTPYSNPTETYAWITPTHTAKASTYAIAADNTERNGATITKGSDYEIEKGSGAGNVDMSGISFTFTNTDRTASALTYKQTEAGGQTKSISIKQSGGTGSSNNYTIGSPSQSWITVSGGNVSISKNETGSLRTGTVTATHNTDSSKKVVVTIKQKAEDIEFTVSPAVTEFAVAGGTKTSTVTSKINGSAVGYSIDNKTAFSWLTITDASNVTTFVASANNTYKSGVTTVTATTTKVTGSCTSTGGSVTLSSTSYFTGSNPKNEAVVNYTQTGGKATATYTTSQPASNVDVNDYTFSLKNSSDTWLTISGKTITASKNGKDSDRSAVVVATNKYDTSKKIEITVSQPKAVPVSPTSTRYANFVFTISPTTWNPTAAAQNKADGITSTADVETLYDNGTYYVTTSAKTISYTCDKAGAAAGWAYGSSGKVYVGANTKGAERNSVLTFTQGEGSTKPSVTLTVTQQKDAEAKREDTGSKEYKLSVSPESLDAFPLGGGSKDLSCAAQQRIIYKVTYVSGAVDNPVYGDWTTIANGFTTEVTPASSWLSWASNKATAANNGTGQERSGSIKFTHKSDTSQTSTVAIIQAGDVIETGTEYQIISNNNPLTIACNASTGDAKIVVQSRNYSYYKTTGKRISGTETSWSNTTSTSWTVGTDTNFSGTNGSSTVTSKNGVNTNSSATRTGSLTYTLSGLTAATGLDSVKVIITQNADEKGDQKTEYRINETPTIPTIAYTGAAQMATVDVEYQTYNVYKYGGGRYPSSESGWKDGNQSEISSSVASPFSASGTSISASSNPNTALPDLDSDYTISVSGFSNFAYGGETQTPTITYTKRTTTGRKAASSQRTATVTFTYHGKTATATATQSGQAASSGTKGAATSYNGSVKSYTVTGTGFSQGGTNGVTAAANPASGKYSPTGEYGQYRLTASNMTFAYDGETQTVSGTSYRTPKTKQDAGSSRTGTVTYTSTDGATLSSAITLTQNAHPGGEPGWGSENSYTSTVTVSSVTGTGFSKSGTTQIVASANPAGTSSTSYSNHTLSASDLSFTYSGETKTPTFTYKRDVTTTIAAGSTRSGSATLSDGNATTSIGLSQNKNPGSTSTEKSKSYTGSISSYTVSGTGFSKSSSTTNGVVADLNPGGSYVATGDYTGYSMTGSQSETTVSASGGTVTPTLTWYRTPITQQQAGSSRTGTATYTSSDGAKATSNLSQNANPGGTKSTGSRETYTGSATYTVIGTGGSKGTGYSVKIGVQPTNTAYEDSQTTYSMTVSDLSFGVSGGTKTPTITYYKVPHYTTDAVASRTISATYTDANSTSTYSPSWTQSGRSASSSKGTQTTDTGGSLSEWSVTAQISVFSKGTSGSITCKETPTGTSTATGNYGNYTFSVSPSSAQSFISSGGYKDFTVTYKRCAEYKTAAVDAITNGKATYKSNRGSSVTITLSRDGRAQGSATYGTATEYSGSCTATITNNNVSSHYSVSAYSANKVFRVICPAAPDNGSYSTSPSSYTDYTISVSDFSTFAVGGGTQSPTISYGRTPVYKRGTGTAPTGSVKFTDGNSGSGSPVTVSLSQTACSGVETKKGTAASYTGSLSSYTVSGTGFSKGGTNGVTASSNASTTSKPVWRVTSDSSVTVTVGDTASTNSKLQTASASFNAASSSRSGSVTYTSSNGATATKSLSQSGQSESFIGLTGSWTDSSDTAYTSSIGSTSVATLKGTKPETVTGVAAGSTVVTFTTSKTPVISSQYQTCTCTVTVEAKKGNSMTIQTGGTRISSTHPIRFIVEEMESGSFTELSDTKTYWTSPNQSVVVYVDPTKECFIKRYLTQGASDTNTEITQTATSITTLLGQAVGSKAKVKNEAGNVITLTNVPIIDLDGFTLTRVSNQGTSATFRMTCQSKSGSAIEGYTVSFTKMKLTATTIGESSYAGFDGTLTMPLGGSTSSNSITIHVTDWNPATGITLTVSEVGYTVELTSGYSKYFNSINNFDVVNDTR